MPPPMKHGKMSRKRPMPTKRSWPRRRRIGPMRSRRRMPSLRVKYRRAIRQPMSTTARPEREKVMASTQANRPDEIAETDAFFAREISQSDKAANVNDSAVDIPPSAGLSPRVGTMEGKISQRQQGLH